MLSSSEKVAPVGSWCPAHLAQTSSEAHTHLGDSRVLSPPFSHLPWRAFQPAVEGVEMVGAGVSSGLVAPGWRQACQWRFR